MKQRKLGKMFLLFIVTLGIYRLYWLIRTRKEILKHNPNIKILPPAILILPYVLILVSLGFMLVNAINQENRVRAAGCVTDSRSQDETNSYYNNQAFEIPSNDDCQSNVSFVAIGLFYLACMAFLPLQAWWMWGYSRGVEAVTKEKLSFAIALIVLLIVPDGIDMLLVQDSFNKAGKSTAETVAA